MGIKKVGAMLAVLSWGMTQVGCSYQVNGESRKIILEEDVRESLKQQQPDVRVTMEEVEIDVEEGDVFGPAFYHKGKLYGSVAKAVGAARTELDEAYPVMNFMKEYLYTLEDKGTLRATNKQVFNDPKGTQIMGYDRKQPSRFDEEQENQILSIDYTRENVPQVLEKLTQVVNELNLDEYVGIHEIVTGEGKHIYQLNNYKPYKGANVFFYEAEEEKLYRIKEGIKDKKNIQYIPAIGAFVHIDENYQTSKVVFNEETFEFEDYIDLGQYIQKEENQKAIDWFCINEEEILLIAYKHVKETEVLVSNPIHSVRQISLFNFTTNQYEELLVLGQGEYLNFTYVGYVPAVSSPMLIMDTFEEEGEYLRGEERSFRIIEDRQLKTIYTEDIQSEGLSIYPGGQGVISEQGNEIFFFKDRITMKKDAQTGADRIYKRYRFE